jgi:hypothetical protein
MGVKNGTGTEVGKSGDCSPFLTIISSIRRVSFILLAFTVVICMPTSSRRINTFITTRNVWLTAWAIFIII